MPRKIFFYDTTLRDGEQTPFVVFSVKQKLEIARALSDLGIDIIEAGFPAAAESEQEALRLISKELREPVIAGLARCRKGDIEVTAKALDGANKPRISIVLPISDRHLSASLRLSRPQALESISEAVAFAKTFVGDVEFIATDATRTAESDLLASLLAAAESGATTVVVADTVGCGLPEEMKSLFQRVRAAIPLSVKLGIHCHNDFGLATANSLAALEGGADQVEGTINGLGERAGNTALEEVAMILKYHGSILRLKSDINTTQILETSRLVREVSGVTVQPNKALVGQNAFLHAAGMHQQAMLADPLTFEPLSPAEVGGEAALEDRIIFGKFLGKNGLKRLLALDGLELSDEKLDALVARIRAAIERRETVTRRDMLSWARD
ncbi:MAG: 2-isopropylmalate synthase [Calditrichaeota bacterium]|nr:2-isopropylmalate synthase [Calditrichota bacterium]